MLSRLWWQNPDLGGRPGSDGGDCFHGSKKPSSLPPARLLKGCNRYYLDNQFVIHSFEINLNTVLCVSWYYEHDHRVCWYFDRAVGWYFEIMNLMVGIMNFLRWYFE